MRVVFDVRACLGEGAGVNTYTRELIHAFASEDHGVEPEMWFLGRRVEALSSRLTPTLQRLQPEVPLHTARVSNEIVYSPRALRFWRAAPRWLPAPEWLPRGVEVYHAPYWPLPPSKRVPMVLTIHDLVALAHAEWSHPTVVEECRTIQALAGRAAQVICPSAHSREQALEHCRLDPARVKVVHDGVGPGFLTAIGYAEAAAARELIGLDRPYIVSLSTFEPRKNLGRLVAAYDRLCARRGPLWDLVLIGAAGWGDTRVDELLKQPRRGRVILPGRVSQQQLAPLLAGAEAMAFVSLAEGFGLPPLEAMAVGCPVVASNTTSLPEVVGDAGLLVDPKDIQAISDGLERILTDSRLAAELSAKGRARAAQFTWQRAAAETAEVYRQALSG